MKRWPALTKSGFTLIELLVVISIIGILATLLVANYNATRERGRDAQRKNDMRQMQNALELYFQDNKRYPMGTALSNNSNFLSVLRPSYLPTRPRDPKNLNDTDATNPRDGSATGFNYYYESQPTGCDNAVTLCNNYNLYARFENASDSILDVKGCNLLNASYTKKCYYLQAP